MHKFTLRNLQYGYDSVSRSRKFLEHKLGFTISAQTAPQYEPALVGSSVADLNACDEVVVSYNSGGSYHGWFIGRGKTTKYVCIIWMPRKDYFRIVDVMEPPTKADWSRYCNSPGLDLIKPKLEEYRSDPTVNFTLDLID